MTDLIYNSHDVAGNTAYRIPATFAHSHVYANTMVNTIPILFGAIMATRRTSRIRVVLILIGLAAAFFGILFASTKFAFLVAGSVVLFSLLSGKIGLRARVCWCVLIFCVMVTAGCNERFQRFRQLGDQSYVENRITGSVNREFWEILIEYPLGNGLGGGGTSMPYFLEGLVKHPVMMENEYCRILLEQSIIGLLLWICFLCWLFSRLTWLIRTPWSEGRRLAWLTCLIWFVGAMIGVGMFTAVPTNVLLFVMVGWFSVRPAMDASKSGARPVGVRVKTLHQPASIIAASDATKRSGIAWENCLVQ